MQQWKCIPMKKVSTALLKSTAVHHGRDCLWQRAALWVPLPMFFTPLPTFNRWMGGMVGGYCPGVGPPGHREQTYCSFMKFAVEVAEDRYQGCRRSRSVEPKVQAMVQRVQVVDALAAWMRVDELV